MIYLLMFNDLEVVDGAITVRIGRPVSFQTVLRNFIFDHETLNNHDAKFYTKDITGVLKMEKDFPYDYELTIDGELIENDR